MKILPVEVQTFTNFINSVERHIEQFSEVILRCKDCKPKLLCIGCGDAMKSITAVSDNMKSMIAKMEEIQRLRKEML